MSKSSQSLAIIAALCLPPLALVACASPNESAAASSSKGSAVTATAPTETTEDGCATYARIHLGRMNAKLNGHAVDTGSRELAEGTVTVDDAGHVLTYTVAPGDAPDAIGQRLCIENALAVATLNHSSTVHAGQVLRLDPDPNLPWVPYYNPADAPAGFDQIAYQAAIQAMGAAADAGDVEQMRVIWYGELAGMFTTQSDIDAIQQALDDEDPDTLRQMFS